MPEVLPSDHTEMRTLNSAILSTCLGGPRMHRQVPDSRTRCALMGFLC